MAGYSLLDRILHRLALQAVPISELSFDIDQKAVDSEPEDIVGGRHVFISGLARAGTTILMRRFHSTGVFRSLTYRDMPFVLAPKLWQKLGQFSKRNVAAVERAHGDRILVDIDSPESLDEVFWRTFTGKEYIEKTHLKPHSPAPEIIWKYVCYVNAILNAQGGGVTRYLSKNNNNLLRLNSIRKAFPHALILVPFRDPLSHAGSLLRQHRNFVDMQTHDRFVRSYMTWLVHHEFGLTHRPFRFSQDDADHVTSGATNTIDYWLELWCKTYEWLERVAPDDVIFVCYEDLCSSEDVWNRIARIAEVTTISEEHDALSLSNLRLEAVPDVDLAKKASTIYARLADRARTGLSDEPLWDSAKRDRHDRKQA